MSRAIALILAGGVGKRLSILTRSRAKPAVPFAGRYRIIDFTLTNCVKSGILEAYVLTQYISRSLVRHIGIGKPWDLDRLKGGLHILHPHLGNPQADWYQGTADAIYQNIAFIESLDCERILMLSGDHVYRMDYREFLSFHESCGKPASIGVVEVPRSLVKEFGIAEVDSRGELIRFSEKPESSESNLASMGIYIFDKRLLISIVSELKRENSDLDFGKHVIPVLVKRGMISAFRFGGYWLDIGTVKGYFMASMGLLAERSRLKLYDPSDPVLTRPEESPPLALDRGAKVERSLICNGCAISGEVRSSILSPGVRVEKGARIESSIVFHECSIGAGSMIRNTILDKGVLVGRRASVGFGDARVPNRFQPAFLDSGITLIGKGTVIPPDARIGTNCLVDGSPADGSIPKGEIEDGGYYLADKFRA